MFKIICPSYIIMSYEILIHSMNIALGSNINTVSTVPQSNFIGPSRLNLLFYFQIKYGYHLCF